LIVSWSSRGRLSRSHDALGTKDVVALGNLVGRLAFSWIPTHFVRTFIRRTTCRAYVRVRPDDSDVWVVDEDGRKIHQEGNARQAYRLDGVLDARQSNARVYEETSRGLVREVVDVGINATVFAYGQTSSGKTHTMRGTAEDPGVIPRAVEEVFALVGEEGSGDASSIAVSVSYMEIYNEEIRDLLAEGDRRGLALGIGSRQDGGMVVQGLQEVVVNGAEEAIGLLDRGDAQRRVGETRMNSRSSRSHAIFRMRVSRSSEGERERGTESELMLVDLAGSERLGKTGAEGQRQKEGTAINRSLLVLGTVISKLSSAATGGVAGPGSGIHVPYRDSKLTRVLQPALGGNSKTAIICAMTPAAKHCDESHNSLMFACRAKTIVNEVRVGVDGGDGDAGPGRLDEEAVKRLVKRKVESMTSFMLFGGGDGPGAAGAEYEGVGPSGSRRQSMGAAMHGHVNVNGDAGLGEKKEKRARRVTCSDLRVPTSYPSDTVSTSDLTPNMMSSTSSLLERYKRDLEVARKDLKRVAQEKGDVLPALKEAQWMNRQLEKDVEGYKAEIASLKASLKATVAGGGTAAIEDCQPDVEPTVPATTATTAADASNPERDYEAQIAELQACADAAVAHVRYLEDKADQESREKEAAIAELEARHADKTQSMEKALRDLEDSCEKSKLEVDALESEGKALKDENDALLKRIGMASGTLNALDEMRDLKKKHREELSKLNAQIRNLTVGSKGNERAAERASKDTNRLKNQIQDLEIKLKKAISEKSALQSEKATLDREHRTAKASLEKLNKNAERAAAAEERRRQPILNELEETKAKLATAEEDAHRAIAGHKEAAARADELEQDLEASRAEAAGLSAALESERATTADLSATMEAERATAANVSTLLEERTFELNVAATSLQEANKNVARLNEAAKQDRHRIEEGAAERVQLEAAIAKLKEEKQMLEDSLEAAEGKVEMMDEMQLDLAAERSHIATMKKNFEVMEKGLEDHKRESEALKKTVEEKDAHAKDAAFKMNEAVARAAELQAELDAAGGEIRKTKSLLSQAENAIEEHEITITEIHKEKIEVEKALGALELEVESLRAARADGEQEKAGLDGRVQALETELAAAQKAIDDERASGNAKLDDMIAVHEAALLLKDAELETSRSALEALQLEAGCLRAENVEKSLALEKLETIRGELVAAEDAHAAVASEASALAEKAEAALSALAAAEAAQRAQEEQLQSLRGERDRASLQVAEAVEAAEALRAECAAAKAAVDKAEQDKADAIAEAKASVDKMKDLNASRDAEKAEYRALSAATAATAAETAEAAELLRETAATAARDKAEAEDALRVAHAELHDTKRTLAEERAAAKSTIEQLRNELRSAESKPSASSDASKKMTALESELRKSKRREEKLQAMMYRLSLDVKESGGCENALKTLRSVRELEFDLDRAQNQISRLRSQLAEQQEHQPQRQASAAKGSHPKVLERRDQNVA